MSGLDASVLATVPLAANGPGYFDAPGQPHAVMTMSVHFDSGSLVPPVRARAEAHRGLSDLVEKLQRRRDNLKHDGRDYLIVRAPERADGDPGIWLIYADDFANADELAALKPGSPIAIAGRELELIAFVDTHDGERDNIRAYGERLSGGAQARAEARAKKLVRASLRASPFLQGLRSPRRGSRTSSSVRNLPHGALMLPRQTVADDHLRIFVFGDSGKGSEVQRAVSDSMGRDARMSKPHFALHTGDIIYPSGVRSADDPALQTLYADHYDQMGVPVYTSLGNHDHKTSGSPGAYVEFANSLLDDAMLMPGRYYRFRYDFKGGSAEFFVVDSHVIERDPRQRTWLSRSLGDSTADWKIVVGHHPTHSGGQHGPDLGARRYMLSAMREHGVQAYFSGHEHDQQLIVDDRMLQLISGSAGSGRKTGMTAHSLFASGDNGYMRVDLSADRLKIDVQNGPESRTLFSTCFERSGVIRAD